MSTPSIRQMPRRDHCSACGSDFLTTHEQEQVLRQAMGVATAFDGLMAIHRLGFRISRKPLQRWNRWQ
jgi:hypothetical protein